ncbi:hypothetical protein BpHYR1_003584 [Brachionus plicatilis]|uniref:Uncharacterized protein n=1 Tax=Brachionus plicatilis TaxID=10195 RepID=A0A3M7SZ42_BRAPC|nr:hypothetical protein BpHYR1_003584 [Brachionus plicatilis]
MYETIKKDLPKAEVVKRFTGPGYKRRSVYRWLDVIEKDKTFKRKKRSENKIRTCLSNMNPKFDYAKTVRSRPDIKRRHGEGSTLNYCETT